MFPVTIIDLYAFHADTLIGKDYSTETIFHQLWYIICLYL